MKTDINKFVNNSIEEYKKLLNISQFPEIKIIPKNLDLKKCEQQGFETIAAAFYDVLTGQHTIEIFSSLHIPESNGRYILNHELTHILDAEVFSQKNKIKHVSNKGYTEYHASQIEFLTLLGITNINKPFHFSMKCKLETFGGCKTAEEYVQQPIKHANEMIQRPDFPATIEALTITIGRVFNYYGLRSICKMYAEDFYDNVDTSIIASFFGIDTINFLNNLMCEWFDTKKVEIIDNYYRNMIIKIAKKNNLN